MALRRRSTWTATLLPGDETLAIAINSQGDIGGDQYQPTGDYRVPIVYSGGTVYQLNAPHAGISSTILWLNSSGQACGINRNGMWATVWTYAISGGSIASQSATDISPYLSAAFTGYEASQAYSINDSGLSGGRWSTTMRKPNPNDRRLPYNMNTNAVTSLPLTFATQLGLGIFTPARAKAAYRRFGEVVGKLLSMASRTPPSGAAAGGLQDLNTLDAGIFPQASSQQRHRDRQQRRHRWIWDRRLGSHIEQAFLLCGPPCPATPTWDGRVDVQRSDDRADQLRPDPDDLEPRVTSNGDGKVDVNDLTIVLSKLRQHRGHGRAGRRSRAKRVGDVARRCWPVGLRLARSVGWHALSRKRRVCG